MSALSCHKVNPFGASFTGDPTSDTWINMWKDGKQTFFHMTSVHPVLVQLSDMFFGDKPLPMKWLIPLCGQTVDMLWLASQGHHVIGVELCEQACRDFFVQHNLSYNAERLTDIGGLVFKSQQLDVDITVYCCNLFELSAEKLGAVDVIWDRASLVAFKNDDQKQYVEKMISLMIPSTTYFLDAWELDHSKFMGPPYSIKEEEIRQLYGSKCTVKKLLEKDGLTEVIKQLGVAWRQESAYLIKLN